MKYYPSQSPDLHMRDMRRLTNCETSARSGVRVRARSDAVRNSARCRVAPPFQLRPSTNRSADNEVPILEAQFVRLEMYAFDRTPVFVVGRHCQLNWNLEGWVSG